MTIDGVARVTRSPSKKPSILIGVSPIEKLETSRWTGKVEPIAVVHEERFMCTNIRNCQLLV